jgi:hypothetical protein
LLLSHAEFDPFNECFDEPLLIEGLAQEGHRTGLQRPFTNTCLVVGSDKDHWERVFTTD